MGCITQGVKRAQRVNYYFQDAEVNQVPDYNKLFGSEGKLSSSIPR
jgi:hypothetical protein